MTEDDTVARLRSVANKLHEARMEMDYGELQMPSEESQDILREMDELTKQLEQEVRQFAMNVEVENNE